MKCLRLLILPLLVFFSRAALADSVEVCVDKNRSSWSHDGLDDIHTETSPAFPDKMRKLTDGETARLRVEWISAVPGKLHHMDYSVPQTSLWAPAVDGSCDRHLGVKGRLVLVSADGKKSTPVTWRLPVRVMMESRPGTAPDWTSGHGDGGTVTADTIVEKNGIFLAAFNAGALRRVPGKDMEFHAGLCLGSHKGKTMTWKSRTPVLAQSLTAFTVKGPPVLSRIQQIINAAPLPDGDSFDCVALIRAINELHALGRDQALAELKEFFALSRYVPGGGKRVPEDISTADPECLFGILMLLFESDSPAHPGPPSVFGDPARLPQDLAKVTSEWPLFPFALADDVPFCLVRGLNPNSLPGHLSTLLLWAEAHGKLRAKPLRPASDPVTIAAKLLSSPAGQYLFRTKGDPYTLVILPRQAVKALPELFPLSPAGWRFLSSRDYDGDADWLACQNKAASLALQWDPAGMRWVPGKQ